LNEVGNQSIGLHGNWMRVTAPVSPSPLLLQ